jgi:hypothetical protein
LLNFVHGGGLALARPPARREFSGVSVMERFSGLLLMLAGSAMVGYTWLPTPQEDQTNFTVVARSSALPESQTTRGDSRNEDKLVRTFSPTSPAFRQRDQLDRANAAVLAAGSKSGTWTTVVTPAQTRTAALNSSKRNDWQTRYELARDLQRELRRVGCYGGEINGTWTRSTKAAMADFMDRVNATLPVDTPDYILLTLVRNHREIACGAECPSGQVNDGGGRCVPRAVVAQASKKSQRLQERLVAEARLAAEGRRDRVASSSSSRSWQQSQKPPRDVAFAEPEKLPWLENRNQPAPAATTRFSEPLPGRMAIGGPVAADVPSSSVAASSSGWQQVPIENSDSADRRNLATAKTGGTDSAVAALAPADDADVDDGASQVSGDAPTAQLNNRVAHPTRGHRKASRASRYRDEFSRPRPSYASSGKRRRGDPRPGTMGYNVARVLGGIY